MNKQQYFGTFLVASVAYLLGGFGFTMPGRFSFIVMWAGMILLFVIICGPKQR